MTRPSDQCRFGADLFLGQCDVYENPKHIRLTSPRWYASTVRLEDGSIIILGGMVAGGYNNVEVSARVPPATSGDEEGERGESEELRRRASRPKAS